MADVSLSSIVDSGGAAFRLAPDLNYISNNISPEQGYRRISSINGSTGFATALSLTGKFAIPLLKFQINTGDSASIRMTVDGTLIIDDSFTTSSGSSGGVISLAGGSYQSPNNSSPALRASTEYPYLTFTCESSLLLEISTTSTTSADLYYIARPVL